jgi:hypothetical protein
MAQTSISKAFWETQAQASRDNAVGARARPAALQKGSVAAVVRKKGSILWKADEADWVAKRNRKPKTTPVTFAAFK